MRENVIVATGLDWGVIIGYFTIVLGFGAWFGRYTRSTKDFFFGGQRFSWWLIAMSCVATVVGSYSFMKYSTAGFEYGLSSSMTYLNDWLILPFFILGWFPIIYFTRVTSIPEYFEKRFDRKTRIASLVLILLYMVGYVGINFYTLGVALAPLLGVDLYVVVGIIAVVSAVYMHAGGQTSVIMTDLLQGFVLLAAGFALLFLGLSHLGGFEAFIEALPFEHRLPLAGFNRPAGFNFVGIFWQDALASSVAFYFMNQGVLMRFMSVKSPRDGYKAVLAVVLFLMPLAALAIANSGWLGRAMVTRGILPADVNPGNIFLAVANVLTQPGLFGLILAALTAALMSTIDTLITAISAVFVNDIWKPFVAPDREDRHYLKVARGAAIGTTILGVALVPVFAQEKSIYAAHGKFIAVVTPAMIVVILLSVFWKRFTPAAAFWTLIGGSAVVMLSTIVPEVVIPFSHGIPMEGGFRFIRAFFGIAMAMSIGVTVTWFTRPKDDSALVGLVIDSIEEAKRVFKGGVPNDAEPGETVRVPVIHFHEGDGVTVSPAVIRRLRAEVGDIVYVSDPRRYFGGLRSVHVKILGVHDQGDDVILMPEESARIGHFNLNVGVSVEKVI